MSSSTASILPPPAAGDTPGDFLAWIRRYPVEALLLTLSAGVIIYFFGFYNVFMNGVQSTAVWAWKGWNEENDQVHCRFIVPIIGVLLWLRRAELRSVVKAPSGRGLAFVIGGIVLFVLAVRCLQPRFAIVSFPLIAYGAAEYLGGRAFARIFIFPCLLMLFMIPIGGIIQGTVTLQLLASKAVGALCALLGIHIQIIGTTINADGHSFEVAGGCSGIRSLMAMTMLSALYVYFALRQPWQQFAVFAGSIVFALIGNIARLFTVVLVAKWWDPQIAGGLYHDYSGFVFFPIAVLAMVGFGNLLSRDWSRTGSGDGSPSGRENEVSKGAADEETERNKPTSPISYDY